jgi:uncharacterized protein
MLKQAGCHVMAKPSGSICNIDCEYCFYLEKEKLYPERNQNWRMDDETLEQYIKQHIEAQSGTQVEFAWQGGEPTLLGIKFYRRVIELCQKYGEGKQIYHAFQTNGVLINDEWCQFFKENDFLIGLSIDGPADLHDRYRVTRSKKATHHKVLDAITLMKEHGVEFNTLTVVHAENVKYPLRVYQFLKDIGSTYIQFIPLVERYVETTVSLASPEQQQAKVTPWSVPAKQYGQFLNTIFDHWVENDVGNVFVQMFDSTLGSWLGESAGLCLFSENCGHAFALEANGDLYQCDHYVYPEYKLGNIHNKSIKEMNTSDEAIKFGQAKSGTLNSQCLSCSYKFACYGGCPKHRFSTTKSGTYRHNYLCQGYYDYFAHTERAMKIMATLIKNQRPPTQIMNYLKQEKQQAVQIALQTGTGRNDPCPCGSGKKYKKCCAH